MFLNLWLAFAEELSPVLVAPTASNVSGLFTLGNTCLEQEHMVAMKKNL